MAPRATFAGFIRLSLVSVPVKAFTATNSGGDIRLNQLHAECNSRVKYKKVCPSHGELSSDDIVSGYEYTKDQYVVIDTDELAAFRKQSDKAIDVEGFISADDLEPMYFSGRTYYLLPDGAAGQKAYQLLHHSMVEDGLFALSSVIMSGRRQMAVIRPVDNLLGMTLLTYHAKLKGSDQFSEELNEVSFSEDELALTKTLIEASAIEEFDFTKYSDSYTEELRSLIEAKVEGQEIVSPPDLEEPKVINLMEALKASVDQATGATKPDAKDAKKVKTKMAPSAKRAATRKKKSG